MSYKLNTFMGYLKIAPQVSWHKVNFLGNNPNCWGINGQKVIKNMFLSAQYLE